MYKINIHRFSDESTSLPTITQNVVVEGELKNAKQVIDFLKDISNMGGQTLDISFKNVDKTIGQLETLQKLLSSLKTSKLNINGLNEGIGKTGLLQELSPSTQKLMTRLGGAQEFVTGPEGDANYQNLMIQLDAMKAPLEEVRDMYKAIDSAEQGLNGTMDETSSKMKDAKNATKDLNDEVKKSPSLVDSMSKAFKNLEFVKLVQLTRVVKRVTTSIVNAVDKAAEYEESLNLYKMALGQYSDDATKWSNEITDKLMLDPSKVMQYTGSFFNLARGMGVANDHAFTMSRTLTQLTYDMSSYLNISAEAAQNKLQSAMAGQSRAVASVGIATQQASLQELVYSLQLKDTNVDLSDAALAETQQALGIKTKVSAMSQADKTYLRYIQLLRSTTHMQGDLARTMITPANAIRVLKTQLDLLARSFGQMLIPFIMKAIPYIMALSSVLQDLATKFANLFGYKIADVNNDFTILENNMSNLGAQAEGTGKKIKNSLAPFDELNVVSSTTSGTGAGAGVGPTIDWDKYVKDYDMLDGYIDTLKTKAEGLKGTVETLLGVFGALLAAKWFADRVKGFGDLVDAIGKISGNKSHTGLLGTLKGLFGSKEDADAASSALDNSKQIADSANGAKKSILPDWGTLLKGLAELAVVVTAVGTFVAAVGLLITTYPQIKTWMTEGVDSLKLVFGGLASIMIPLAAFSAGAAVLGTIPITQFLAGLADLALVIAGTTAVITAIGAILSIGDLQTALDTGIQAVKDTFDGLASICIPLGLMTAAMLALGTLGVSGVGMITAGLADMALVMDGTVLVVTAIGALISQPGWGNSLDTGIKSIKDTFNALSEVCVPLGLMTGALTLLGITGLAGTTTILAGLGNFALIVGGLTAVVIVIGDLLGKAEFKQLLATGFDVLSTLGEGIGEFAGSLIGGVGAGISNGLPKIGDNLTKFADSSAGFFVMLSSINSDTSKSAKNLAEAILAITKAELLQQITGWLTGKISMPKFGTQLSSFGKSFKEYADEIGQIKNTDIVAESVNVAKSLAELIKNLPPINGMKQAFTGEKSMTVISKDLPEFGKNLKKYSKEIDGINMTDVTESASAGKAIAEMVNSLPSTGSIFTLFTGEKSLLAVSKELPKFGKDMKAYSDNISGMNADKVTESASAGKSIAELVKNLPSEGGFLSIFSGDKSLSNFGGELKSFGEKFKEYYNKIKDIDTKIVDSVSKSLNNLVDNLLTIKNNSLGNTFSNFASDLKNGAGNYNKFFSEMFNANDAKSIGKTFGDKLGAAIKDAIKNKVGTTLNVTDSSGKKTISTFSIQARANGGFVDSGDLFFANENGVPEYITSIGGRSAVANQDQMVSALSGAIITAMSKIPSNSSQPGVTQVYIGNDKVYEGQGTYQNRQNDRYGTTYIKI